MKRAYFRDFYTKSKKLLHLQHAAIYNYFLVLKNGFGGLAAWFLAPNATVRSCGRQFEKKTLAQTKSELVQRQNALSDELFHVEAVLADKGYSAKRTTA
jgi:hypothetical protein